MLVVLEMNLFDRLLQGTGIVKAKVADKEVVLRENIQYPIPFQEKYALWEGGNVQKNLLSFFLEGYKEKRFGTSSNTAIQLYESKNANGLYFKTVDNGNSEEFNFLVYGFIQKLKGNEYVYHQAIREITDEDGLLKTTETHYLKPSLKYRKEVPYKQLFGNVQIEHRLVDGESESIKIMATTYTDRNYERSYDFEDLMSELFVWV